MLIDFIRLLGEDLSDSRVVEEVLVSLPEKFEHKISSLEDSKDLETFSLNELVNSLQAVEQRQNMRKEFEEAPQEEALIAADRNKSQKNFGD